MSKHPTTTADLGQGWFASLFEDGSATIRNPDKGQRIDLSPANVAKFRELYAKAEAMVRPQ